MPWDFHPEISAVAMANLISGNLCFLLHDYFDTLRK